MGSTGIQPREQTRGGRSRVRPHASALNHCSLTDHKLCSYAVHRYTLAHITYTFSMPSRKFTVFIDDVSTVKPQPTPNPAPTKAPEEEASPSLSATEKENLHPLTGGRLRSSSTAGLKRKSSVLATKLHNPPDTKDFDQAPSLAQSKKRKVASSSDGGTERSRPKARRLKSTTHGRRSPELASIAEEKDERLARRLSQSNADSRCYDLTVSPLANVSDAFAHTSPSASKDSKTKAATKRVRWIILSIYLRWPSSHGHFTGLFCRTSTPRLRSLSCRCSHYY